MIWQMFCTLRCIHEALCQAWTTAGLHHTADAGLKHPCLAVEVQRTLVRGLTAGCTSLIDIPSE